MRKLRELAGTVRDCMAATGELSFDGVEHGLTQNLRDVQILYRPIRTGGKNYKAIPWLAYRFTPFLGLIEPFNIYPGEYWAFQQIHKQPSGLPELVTVVSKEFPSASHLLTPHLYAGFSNSPNIENDVITMSEDPLTLRFRHSCNLMRHDRSTLPRAACLPGIELALSQGFPEDGIPGLVEGSADMPLFLGDLVFYNQGRTVDRGRLGHFLLNNAAVAFVFRNVRDALARSGSLENASA